MYLESVILPLSEELLSVFPEDLLPCVSEERQNTIRKFRYVEDRTLSLFGALLIRYLAETHTQIRQKDLRFSKLSFGKPILENAPDFHFNLSHCKGLIFAVCSDTSPVGADAEGMSDAYREILSCLHEEERKEVLRLSEEDARRLRFFEIWTRKEAFVKRSGEGMNRDFTSFDTTKYPENFLSEQIMISGAPLLPITTSISGGPARPVITSICAAPELLKIHTRTQISADDLRNFFSDH